MTGYHDIYRHLMIFDMYSMFILSNRSKSAFLYQTVFAGMKFEMFTCVTKYWNTENNHQAAH